MKPFYQVLIYLKRYINTIRKYIFVIHWLIKDSIIRYQKKILVIIASSFAGLVLQIQAIAVALLYSRAIERGGNFSILFLDFSDVRNSATALFVCATGVLASLLVSSWLVFFSRTRVLLLWREYEIYCSTRAIVLLSKTKSKIDIENLDPTDQGSLIRLVRTDAKYSGRALEIIINSIIPLFTVIISLATLFVVDFILTCVVALAVLISTFFLFQSNRLASDSSRSLENYASPSLRVYSQIIQWIHTSTHQFPRDAAWIRKKIFSSGDIKRSLDAFHGRLIALAKSELIGSINFSVVIFIIILILGGGILLGSQNWDGLLIYLVALRYCLANVKLISSRITAINLFYPHIKRYYRFISAIQPSLDYSKPCHNLPTLSSPHLTLTNSLKSWTLEEGNRIALIGLGSINRYLLDNLSNVIFKEPDHKLADSIRFVTKQMYCLPFISLRDSLGFPDDYNLSRLCKKS